MQREYHYRDIFLLPRFSDLNSRAEADASVQFGPIKFKLPIVPANMKTIIDEKLARWLASNGYFYIMHRFDIDLVEFSKRMKQDNLFVSISVGVNKDSYELLTSLKNQGIEPEYITVDIAHGESIKMRNTLAVIKHLFPNSFVIAGNTCTPEGVEAMESWGADCVKAGVGPGSVCTTKLQTGFSRPQFSAVLECSKAAKKPIIADGGIEHNGDIAKALAAGATMVMAGGMFAGFDESAGERIEVNGVHMKEYFGSASEFNRDEKRHVEGKKIFVPLKGPISDKFIEIEQSLKSSISYAGGRDLSAFHSVKWVIQS